ncbi:hypothetical protein IP81_12605 [Novosphingobium sp. AAP83]|uniref:hypothetical protein n=1 Tax=Novosphingobium sp. AAP83 TaxID=1523425 RepID=UPI0006B9A608|nr:hypothetical protein [Novosphingobium sp. AAP83]KPF91042.1 hypothetical protein IP81_12605 [Novosphingobium sp. AAP83]
MPDPAPHTPDVLEPVERLALAYADRQARVAWEALLLLQHRLEDAARPGRDPLMIQLRLAWWRDRLAEPAERRPKGEPLLVRLAGWSAEAPALIGLVDGWEAKVVGEDGGAALAEATIAAYEALGRLVGEKDAKAVRVTAERLLQPIAYRQTLPKLSRRMRPLSVLGAHAERVTQGEATRPWASFAALLRIGLLGR